MLRMNDVEITNHTLLYAEAYKETASAPLLYEQFINNVYPKLWENAAKKYPYIVKIPKSFNEMMEGDFSPSKEIIIEEPITRKVVFQEENKKKGIEELSANIPIWFGETGNGTYLRYGYLNGDSRFYSKVKFDDNDVHMTLGGATGQGKSATLNEIIMSLCDEYPPWELNLTLCDAKIVEFKNYALNARLPHIRSIAATTDADYIRSVLEDLYVEMQRLNTIFTKAKGAKKISDFRRNTGLCIPFNVIVIDEYQTMFKAAGKNINKLVDFLDLFARLGRNTGYRLIMASQEVSPEIKPTLGNIKIRGCLGATASVSQMLLNNDEAKNNMGKKGYLIVNTNTGADNPKKYNELYRVPLITDERLLVVSDSLIKVSEKYNYRNNIIFYDEEEVLRQKNYLEYVKSIPHNSSEILLGEPSFVSHDKVVKITMDKNKISNIAVDIGSKLNSLRIYFMLKYSFMSVSDKPIHNVLCVDNIYQEQGKISDLCHEANFHTKKSYEGNIFFNIAEQTIYKRKLMLDVDETVFKNPCSSESADEFFYESFERGSIYDTNLNRARAHAICILIKNEMLYNTIFAKGSTNSNVFAECCIKYIGLLIKMYELYGSLDRKLTFEKLPIIYNWVMGVDKIIGIGRSSKTSSVNAFTKMLQDCSEVNVHFILFFNTLGEFYDIKEGIQYFLLDNPTNSEISKVKIEDYPGDIPKVLAVLYDKEAPEPDKPFFKFKKMFFNDEN